MLRRTRPRPSTPLALAFALCAAAVIASCGGSKTNTTGAGAGHASSGFGGSTTSASTSTGTASATGGNGGGGIHLTTSSGGACAVPGLDVQPSALQTISVTAGSTMPTVQFQALLDCVPVSAGWGVDKGNVGTIPAGPSSTASFAPTGSAGGVVTITAGVGGKSVTRQVLVKLSATQNGPNSSPGETAQIPSGTGDLTAGGGVGGVGGEGLGVAADPGTIASFANPQSAQAGSLSFLYPYDKTVFPRGLLAPLLMWSWPTGDADGVQLSLTTTTGSFSYTGTFGRPAILSMTNGKFIRMPVPQDVWAMATETAGGSTDKLTVSLIVSKGGMAYGPISETWTIAPTHLSGTIYYNSYGTQLAQNLGGAVGGNGRFGGAVLSIHVGDTAPKLVAGKTTTDETGCRVCHSVAAGGTRLVVQHGDNYGASSAYDLGTMGSTENAMAIGATFPAVYPDGSMALSEGGTLLPLPAAAAPITTTGLTTAVTDLGQPAFSPDGKAIVFNPLGGPGVTAQQTLYTMTFDQASSTFAGLTQIANVASGVRPGWPAFFPDSKSVVFHRQSGGSSCDPGAIVTRSGSRAQIYWTDLTNPSNVTALDQLNGVGYLPKLAAASGVACNDACNTAQSPTIGTINADHSDDVDVNYEPTVAPTASGGYAWVVFTSRRMYGSVATIGSFCSDPRGVDLVKNITPKKLWVAAIDLTQGPGVDGSHPAFYLPAQEILAGNARGFWTLDPCAADGASCQTGDECCNGYCEPGDGGALVCTSTPPNNTCSGVGDKCATSADCCDTTNVCINGFCTLQMPN